MHSTTHFMTALDTNRPDIDGINIWDMLMTPAQYNSTSAHPTLVLSREVLLRGDYKIMTSQHGDTQQSAESYENRWQDQQGPVLVINGRIRLAVFGLNMVFIQHACSGLEPAHVRSNSIALNSVTRC
jgi:hypothetical protein